jgi:hypothetical protein
MNRLIYAGAVLLFVASGASAATTSPPTSSQGQTPPTTAASQAAPKLSQEIRNQLTKDGLSNIKIAPEEYVVHAKNKKGDPVVMVISPNSFVEVTDVKVGSSTTTSAKRVPVEPDPTPLAVQK